MTARERTDPTRRIRRHEKGVYVKLVAVLPGVLGPDRDNGGAG
jgi:hypothetical protein